ncbi:MAG: acetylornithine transaminase [Methanosarcinales archaeon Met12]|nr:MAG: acetylornithine transaminase [Methanosarcinales archaeon Met12]
MTEKYVFQTYARQPIVIVGGRGAVVRDIDGREYIDCVAGIAVNNVGHCHPKVVSAIKKQAELLIHTSNMYHTEPQALLAEKIVEITPMDRVFFCNSGTEAVEAALKLARRASGKTDFIATHGSFHGRSLGALSVTFNEKYRKPFEPLMPGVTFVPYDDADAIGDAITPKTAAVILESIQGESGVRVPSDNYLKTVRDVCDDRNTLLIIDEVQTGFGRTGKWFGFEHWGMEPDIMAMAKALGGGFPIGAMAAREEIAQKFQRGDHASTFGGSPLACAAALGTISALEDGLVKQSEKLGGYFIKRLKELKHDYIREVRGKGLMIGMELNMNGDIIVDKARGDGVLLNCISDTVLRFVPPLVITREQIDRVVEVLG